MCFSIYLIYLSTLNVLRFSGIDEAWWKDAVTILMHRDGTAISNHKPDLGLTHREWRSGHPVVSRDRSSTSMTYVTACPRAWYDIARPQAPSHLLLDEL